jgi:quercetin dioxygenase-like cupin family protein
MQVLDLKKAETFSPDHHVHLTLAESPVCTVSIACWEPGQTSPIHAHPHVEEIYHVLEGEGLFRDSKEEFRLGPRGTVVFAVGEVHQVQALTRMVLYRIQAGPDPAAVSYPDWPR